MKYRISQADQILIAVMLLAMLILAIVSIGLAIPWILFGLVFLRGLYRIEELLAVRVLHQDSAAAMDAMQDELRKHSGLLRSINDTADYVAGALPAKKVVD